MPKKYLSRESILSAEDIKTEEVYVPEWGGTLTVKGLTGEQRDAFEASTLEIRGRLYVKNLKNIRAKLTVLSVVDEKGNPLFSEADVAVLARKSARALDRIFSVAQRLSGLSDADVEELAKNLKSGREEGSILP